jgi:uncharacterized protein
MEPKSEPVQSPAAKLKLSQPISLNRPALVVSVHDVSPTTRAACETIVGELTALGLRRCSLLVIPDHHHTGNFLDDEDFCAWLTAQVEASHEVVIHGYSHQREAETGETLRDKITTRLYTAGEGEFYNLDGETAKQLLTQAREEFRAAGFEPDGFIAPAWLLSRPAEAALRELGFQYTTRLGSVVDLQMARHYDSQSLVWSVRSPWRCLSSLIWNALLFKALRNNRLLRISVHPADLSHPRIWRQIRRCVMRALESRSAFTYERWIARQRFLEVNAAK